MRTMGRPHVCMWSRRKLAAPEWQGKGSYSQRDCDLHTNSLLIDLHLIWPLKLVEGSQRTERERRPLRGQPAARCKPAAVKGRAWLDGHSHPEGDCHGGTMPHFPLQNNRDILSGLSQAISVMLWKAVWKAWRSPCDPACTDKCLLKLQSFLFLTEICFHCRLGGS